MGAPGLLGRPGARGQDERRARACDAQARDLPDAGIRRRRPRAPLPRWPRRTPRWPRSSTSRSRRSRRGSRQLEEERLFSGRYDAGRRARDRQRGRRRHRRAGLGRDGAAHADALGREARLQGRAARGRARGRRRASSRRPSRPRARTPTACSAPRRACTGSCGCRPSTRRTAARRASPASRSRPSSRRAATIEIDDDDLQVDTYRASRRGRPARQQDRLGGAHHAQADGIVVQCQNERSQAPEPATAMGMLRSQARRARGAQAPGGDRQGARRGAGRELRLADPLLRPAPVHDGQGPADGRGDGRRATACSTATSTASCAPTC